MAASAAIGTGAEEDIAALLGFPLATNQLEERRQRLSTSRFRERDDAGGLVSDLAVGVGVQHRGDLGLEVGGDVPLPGQGEQLVAAVVEPGEIAERLATYTQRIRPLKDAYQPWPRVLDPHKRADGRLGGRASDLLTFGLLDQGDDEFLGPRIDQTRDGFDRGGLQFLVCPFLSGQGDQGRDIPGVFGGGGQRNGFEPHLRVFQGRLGEGNDLGALLSGPPARIELASERRKDLTLPRGIVGLEGESRQHDGRLRVSHLGKHVIGRLLHFRAGEVRQGTAEERQDLTAMEPPGQPEGLAQGRSGKRFRPHADVRLVAVDREIRGQGDVRRPAGVFEVEVSVEVTEKLAVEETRDVLALALFKGQAERFQVPSILTIPAFRQGLQSFPGVGGRHVAERQDQLATDPRVGVGGHRQECGQVLRGGRGLPGGSVAVLDLAVFPIIATEHPHALLANPGVRVLQVCND